MAVIVAKQQRHKIVTTAWLAGTGRNTVIWIPKFMAKQHGLDDPWINQCKEEGRPAQIELISQENGILIRKYSNED